eukprot:Gb_40891 [translate_table: standard]
MEGSRESDLGPDNGQAPFGGAEDAVRGLVAVDGIGSGNSSFEAPGLSLAEGGEKTVQELKLPGNFVGDNGQKRNGEQDEYSESSFLTGGGDHLEQKRSRNVNEAEQVSFSVISNFGDEGLSIEEEQRKGFGDVSDNFIWEGNHKENTELIESEKWSFRAAEDSTEYSMGQKNPVGNVNREGNDFLVGLQDKSAGVAALEASNLSPSKEEVKGLHESFKFQNNQHESNIAQNIFSMPSLLPVDDNIRETAGQDAKGGMDRVENALSVGVQHELVIKEFETSSLRICKEGGKGVERLHNDDRSNDVLKINTGQEKSADSLIPEVEGNMGDGAEKDPVGNESREETDLCVRLQDKEELVQERTRMLPFQDEAGEIGMRLDPAATSVGKRSNSHELIIGQDSVEQEAVVDHGAIQSISGTVGEHYHENDPSAVKVDPTLDYVSETPSFHSGNEGPGEGQQDSIIKVNESALKLSNPISSHFQLYNELEKRLAEGLTTLREAGQESCPDALTPSEEVELTEHTPGELHTGYTGKPLEELSTLVVSELAEVGFTQKPPIGLPGAVQSRDDLSATVEEEGTFQQMDFVQEGKASIVRNLVQQKGIQGVEYFVSPIVCSVDQSDSYELYPQPQTCESAPAQAFVAAETAREVADVVIAETNEHENLKKELTGTIVLNQPSTFRDIGANSIGGVQLEEPFDLREGMDKDMQDGSSTSPSSQIAKKFRRRKLSNAVSAHDQLSVQKCGTNEHRLSVGDLVWGKVKSHPWWPGQIFDSSDASEIANRYIKKDCMLVAFFGDATFGWCKESQLIPFEANFEEQEKQSAVAAKAFSNAVMKALDELARRVKLGLTCSCQSEEARRILENKAIVNSGIRDGAIVNNHRDISHAANAFDTSKFLSTIQTLAKSPLMDNNLEITVACAQASAILNVKALFVSGKISAGISGKRTTSKDKPLSTSAVRTQVQSSRKKSKMSSRSSLGKRRRNSEGKQLKKNKKRRIDDLIAGDEASYEAGEDDGHDETLLEIAGSKAKLLKKLLESPQKSPKMESRLTRSGETKNAVGLVLKSDRNDYVSKTKLAEDGSLPRKVTPTKIKKHRKVESIFTSDVQTNDSNAMQGKRDLSSISPGVAQDATKAQKTLKLGECIKKVASELTSTSPGIKGMDVTVVKNTGESGKKLAGSIPKNVRSSPSSKRQNALPVRECSSTRQLLSELLVVAQDPLYWVKEKKMPSRLIIPFLEFRNAVFEKSSANSDINNASTTKSASQIHKPKSLKSCSKLLGSSHTEYLKHSEWTDKASTLKPRSHAEQTKLKRKAESPLEGVRKIAKHSIRLPSPPWSNKVTKQKLEEKLGNRYAKQYSRRPMIPQPPVKSFREFHRDSNHNQNPAALFMRFPKGFALPSEIELKAKFARFGPLELSETRVFRRSGCAQVVFKRHSNAEAAFNFASENNVFGSATVSFRLRYRSSETQTDTSKKTDHGKHERSIQHKDKQASLLKDTRRESGRLQENVVQTSNSVVPFAEKGSTSTPNSSGEPRLLLIQQNLEMLASMLSRSDYASPSATSKSDNAAPDSKTDIMDEMMCLLQKVSALVGSPP